MTLHCPDVPQCISPSPTGGHRGCFQLSPVTAVNIHVRGFVWTRFQLLWVNTEEQGCWTVRFYTRPQTAVQGSCTRQHSHQPGVRAAATPRLHQHLLLSRADLSHSVPCGCGTVLNLHALMLYDVEHLFICLFAICTSLVRQLLISLPIF